MKKITEFPDYTLTQDGQIWSYKRQKYLSPAPSGKGYLAVALYKNGIGKRFYVHRLLAQAFIPNPNGYKEINHRNGIRTDNRLENLEWCNRQQNIDHSMKVGLYRTLKGEEHPRAKLNLLEVEIIRVSYATGKFTQKQLAKRHKIDYRTVGHIVRNERWR